MKGRVAIATVHGKAYYHIVNALREKDINFYSLMPGQSIPARAKLVITTEEEKEKIHHSKVLVFHDESDIDFLMMEVKRLLLGKEKYEKIIFGIDPGEAIGLVVLVDGKVIEEGNYYCSRDLVNSILKILRSVNFSVTSVTIKIGNGVPVFRDLLHDLDMALPAPVALEVVDEAGTNRPLTMHSRKIRHISSAIRIAARTGRLLARRKELAANSTNQ
jgi:hypothetical protein